MFTTFQQWTSSIELGFFDWLSFITYGLFALAYLMRDIKWLRIITVCACSLDLLIFYQIRPGQPMWVQIMFSGLFIIINAVQLYVLWRDQWRSDFEGDAGFLFKNVFMNFSPGEFRRLLKYAQFEDLSQGQHLIRRDEHISHISVLCRGALAIHLGGNTLNTIELGGFIGEMGYLTQRPASANVTASVPSKVLRIERKNLDTMEEKYPDVHAKLILILGRDIANKLRNLNSITDDKDQALSGFGVSAFAQEN